MQENFLTFNSPYFFEKAKVLMKRCLKKFMSHPADEIIELKVLSSVKSYNNPFVLKENLASGDLMLSETMGE